jgi:hypothetical protein
MPQSHALNLDEPRADDAPTPLDISFHYYILLEYSPVRGRGLYLKSFSGGEEGTAGSELAEGVCACGEQPRSITRAIRRFLASNHACRTRASHGGEARRYACRRKVVADGATWSGGGGPHDRLPPEKSGTEGFRLKYYLTRRLLRNGASIREFDQPLPQIGTQLSISCLMKCAEGYRNGTLLIKAVP